MSVSKFVSNIKSMVKKNKNLSKNPTLYGELERYFHYTKFEKTQQNGLWNLIGDTFELHDKRMKEDILLSVSLGHFSESNKEKICLLEFITDIYSGERMGKPSCVDKRILRRMMLSCLEDKYTYSNVELIEKL